MASSIFPVANAPSVYANDAQILPFDQLDPLVKYLNILPGNVRDAENVGDISLPTVITLNGLVNGINGVDQGTLLGSTWYGVYLISDVTRTLPTATLLSSDFSTPVMPQGYSLFRRIGAAITSATPNFWPIYYYGNNSFKSCFYRDPNIILNNSAGSVSAVELDLSGFVPPSSNVVYLQLELTPNSAGNFLNIAPYPTGSAFKFRNPVASVNASFLVRVNCSDTQTIWWSTSSASDHVTISVMGFEDYI